MFGNYYDYSDDYGICVNGLCFENSCVPSIIYFSEICGARISFVNETASEDEIFEEEIPYNKELENFDEDGDKVPDYKDKCPNSIIKYVDKYGCNCNQKRCIDLDGNTIDLCYRGRCIFAIKDSDEYNKTTNLIDLDKEKKPRSEFNFTLLFLLIAAFVFFIIVFLMPSRKKEEENKKEQTTLQNNDKLQELKQETMQN